MDLTRFVHPSWISRFEEVANTMTAASPDDWTNKVVKLQFKKEGQENYGTGFFVNLDTTKYKIILTAGHNLVDNNKQLVCDLFILYKSKKVPVPTDWIRICESYRQNPGNSNKTHDYGAILLPVDPDEEDQGGFGFSLELGLSEKIDSNVYVTGYDTHTEAGSPLLSSGDIKWLQPSYIQYRVQTVPGNSGGPVWVARGKNAMVVAVHNHQILQNGAKSVSQGSRINLDVLRTVCQWAGVGWFSVPLKVESRGVAPPGLYLNFPCGRKPALGISGRVSRGPGKPASTFDILPCQTTMGVNNSMEARYVFLFNQPESDAESSSDEDVGDTDEEATVMKQEQKPIWVRWRTEPVKVQLSGRFSGDCLVRLQPKKKAYEIVKGMKKLRMQDDDIEPVSELGSLEGQESLYQGSQISLIPLRSKHTEFAYCLFTFA